MSDEEVKKEDNIIEPEQNDSEVLEFEFNDDGEEDLKKTLKKFRADLKQLKKEKSEDIFKRLSQIAKSERKEQVEKQINLLKLTDKELKGRIIENFLSKTLRRWTVSATNWR